MGELRCNRMNYTAVQIYVFGARSFPIGQFFRKYFSDWWEFPGRPGSLSRVATSLFGINEMYLVPTVFLLVNFFLRIML